MNNQFDNKLSNGYSSYTIPPTHITFDNCKWTNNYCFDNGGAFGCVTHNLENSLLMIKSFTFNKCHFCKNYCLGNGGSLYLDMNHVHLN